MDRSCRDITIGYRQGPGGQTGKCMCCKISNEFQEYFTCSQQYIQVNEILVDYMTLFM